MSNYANEEEKESHVFIQWNTVKPGEEAIVEHYTYGGTYPVGSDEKIQHEWVGGFIAYHVDAQDVKDATDKVLLDVRDAKTGDVFFSGFLFESNGTLGISYPLFPSYDFRATLTDDEYRVYARGKLDGYLSSAGVFG